MTPEERLQFIDDVAGSGFVASGAKSTLPVSLTYTLV